MGLAPGAAREHVRVARALGTLPRLAQALARGELSYSKVRELTRVATPETEERLLAVGRAGTVQHVERIVRGWRRVDQLDRQPDGELRFCRPDGQVLADVPPSPELPADPVEVLRARHETGGLILHARTTTPGWLGERLDVGWAIDVLHPLAR